MAIKIDANKFFQVAAISFIVVEALSWLLNQIVPDLPFLKGGWIVFMFMLVILLTTLWNFGSNLYGLKPKDFIFMALVLAVIVVLYIFLPQAIPQLFSSIPSQISSGQTIRDFFVRTIGSAISISSSGVV